VGIASTFPILGGLIDRFDWPVTVIMCSALTLVVTGIFAIFTRPTLPERNQRCAAQQHALDWPSLLSVLRHRSVICLTLSYAAQGYFQYVFFYWIQYFFETIQGQTKEVARNYSMWVTLAMGVGMVFGGYLADRVPRSFSPRIRGALVPALAMFFSGAVFIGGLLSNDEQTTLAAFALAAACIGACEGSFWTTSVGLGGRYGGIVAGLMNCGGNAGGTLSPWALPWLGAIFAEHYGKDIGWRLSLAVAGIVVMLGAALWWGVTPRYDHDESPS
jgi:MFS family permease